MYQSFIEALSQSESLVDISNIGNEICHHYGFEHFSYGMKIPLSVTAPQFLVMQTPSENNKPVRVDRTSPPLVTPCMDNASPLSWSTLSAPDVHDSCDMLEQAEEMGFYHGVTIPLHSRHSASAVLTYGTSRNDHQALSEINSIIPELCLVATHKHEMVNKHFKYTDYHEELSSVSRRETECLQWSCEGLTTTDIAKVLEISDSTVTFHIQNAMLKLDASNRQQAIARAIMLGII